MKLFSVACPNCKARLTLLPRGRDWWRSLRLCPHCGVSVEVRSRWSEIFLVVLMSAWLLPGILWNGRVSWGMLLVVLGGVGAIVAVPLIVHRWTVRTYPAEAARCTRVRKWDRLMFAGGVAWMILQYVLVAWTCVAAIVSRILLDRIRVTEPTDRADGFVEWAIVGDKYGVYVLMAVLIVSVVMVALGAVKRERAIKSIVAGVAEAEDAAMERTSSPGEQGA